MNAGGAGSGATGGISTNGESTSAIALRISASEAYIVFFGSSAGMSRTSSGGSGPGSTDAEIGGIIAAISAGLATIVLYGSTSGAASTSGVPSVWQNRIPSSNSLSQFGHFFILVVGSI